MGAYHLSFRKFLPNPLTNPIFFFFFKTNLCVFFLQQFPETKGLALEDVDRLFAKNDEAHRQMSAIVHEVKGGEEAAHHEGEEEEEDVERIGDVAGRKS